MPSSPMRALLSVLATWLLAAATAGAQDVGAGMPTSLFDPRLDELRTASVTWAIRLDQRREVVDQVCLVADLAGFLEAIAEWDQAHYFPILIADSHPCLEFLRAFRPARIVRRPGLTRPIEPDRLWEAAVAAVGRAWAADDQEAPRGDKIAEDLDAAGPGVVVSEPRSPTLAGAVALAAGRFQPLIRWEPPEHGQAVLKLERAEALAFDLEQRIGKAAPRFGRLGDACDFITLAGDYPDRFDLPIPARLPTGGPSAFDDLIGRHRGDRRRWAFAGRLVGGAASSVYQAMCSLFLRPKSALMFDTYDPEHAEYAMAPAARALGAYLNVSVRAGAERADLDGWHRAFDPKNSAELVMVNTRGTPTQFVLPDGPGLASDIPPSAPSAVLMIHSFSAADPNDPETLAGRWLAQGAFVYLGSMNEPFLNAFRTPKLVATLLADGLPIAAAARLLTTESPIFGAPWRLTLLGDPLYRLDRRATPPGRLNRWGRSATWPSLTESPPPAATADAATQLRWVARAMLLRTARPGHDLPGADPIEVLLTIPRERLAGLERAIYEDLLADALAQSDRRRAVVERASAVPSLGRSPALRIALETARVANLQRALAEAEIDQAGAIWEEIIRSDAPATLKDIVTRRVSARAVEPDRAETWRARLRNTLKDLKIKADLDRVEAELRRLDGSDAPR